MKGSQWLNRYGQRTVWCIILVLWTFSIQQQIGTIYYQYHACQDALERLASHLHDENATQDDRLAWLEARASRKWWQFGPWRRRSHAQPFVSPDAVAKQLKSYGL